MRHSRRGLRPDVRAAQRQARLDRALRLRHGSEHAWRWAAPMAASFSTTSAPRTTSLPRSCSGTGRLVSCLCLLSEEVLASGSMDNTIRIWNLRSKEALQVLSGHTDYVRGLAQLSDTQLASASDDKTIRLWNFAKPEDDGRVLQGHSDYVRCLCRSTAGSLVSGSRRHDPPRVEPGHRRGAPGAAWPQTEVVSSASARPLPSSWPDTTVRLWDLTSWTAVRVLEGLSGSVSSLCLLAPNHLAAADSEGRLIVWAVQSGEKVHDVQSAHSKAITALTMAKVRGEHVLCSGSEDSTLKLWQLQARGRGPGGSFCWSACLLN